MDVVSLASPIVSEDPLWSPVWWLRLLPSWQCSTPHLHENISKRQHHKHSWEVKWVELAEVMYSRQLAAIAVNILVRILAYTFFTILPCTIVSLILSRHTLLDIKVCFFQWLWMSYLKLKFFISTNTIVLLLLSVLFPWLYNPEQVFKTRIYNCKVIDFLS